MTIQKISDAEWKIMHAVWRLNDVAGGVTGNDVIAEIVPETGWNPNTVRTLLVRLADKGILHVEKTRGKSSGQERDYPTLVYRPRYTQEECAKVHGRHFLQRVFEGDMSKLLVHFVQDGALTAEQIAVLRKQLGEIEE